MGADDGADSTVSNAAFLARHWGAPISITCQIAEGANENVRAAMADLEMWMVCLLDLVQENHFGVRGLRRPLGESGTLRKVGC